MNPAQAFQIDTTDTVQDTLISPGDNLGDYSLVGEIDGSTGLGNILDILSFSGTASNSGTILDLLNTISASSSDHDPITSTSILGFGFGINESGSNPNILFQDIEITVEYPSVAGDPSSATETITFNLAVDDDTQDPDTDTSLDLDIIASGGNNDSEIELVSEFPFELYSQYSYTDSVNSGIADTYNYTISAQSQNFDAGKEVIFLSSGITSAQQVPFKFSPSLGLVILGIGLFVYRFKNKNRTTNKLYSENLS